MVLHGKNHVVNLIGFLLFVDSDEQFATVYHRVSDLTFFADGKPDDNLAILPHLSVCL